MTFQDHTSHINEPGPRLKFFNCRTWSFDYYMAFHNKNHNAFEQKSKEPTYKVIRKI
jgi:hypothetical protein